MLHPTLNRTGSSPLGRGGPRASVGSSATAGLIPAWAGRTARARRHRVWGRAHPRVGGADRNLDRRQVLPHRLIPAWAGWTERHARGLSLEEAHPVRDLLLPHNWAHPRRAGRRLPARPIRASLRRRMPWAEHVPARPRSGFHRVLSRAVRDQNRAKLPFRRGQSALSTGPECPLDGARVPFRRGWGGKAGGSRGKAPRHTVGGTA